MTKNDVRYTRRLTTKKNVEDDVAVRLLLFVDFESHLFRKFQRVKLKRLEKPSGKSFLQIYFSD